MEGEEEQTQVVDSEEEEATPQQQEEEEENKETSIPKGLEKYMAQFTAQLAKNHEKQMAELIAQNTQLKAMVAGSHSPNAHASLHKCRHRYITVYIGT